jgi:type IV pilus assembly protein PilA
MRTRPGNAESSDGFTLVELLVVIVVVGILATIALTAFLNQRTKAWDSAVQSDLRNAATFQQTILAESGAGQYATTLGQLEAAGFRASPTSNYFGGSVVLTVSAVGGLQYCLTAQSASGQHFALGSDVGLLSGPDAFDPTSCA